MPRSTPHRTNKTHATDRSHSSQAGGFTPAHGGYEDLLSFQKARIVFDGTMRFCDRFVDKRSRTRDQMVQAARSGKQNILEGSQASGTAKETELKLTNVARASLEELLEDYATSCAPAATLSGIRTPRKPFTSESSAANQISPMSPIGPISRLDRSRSSPTPSSA
jgi:hypothetical protein